MPLARKVIADLQSHIAMTGDKKSNTCHIDSGASPNFFHQSSTFPTYVSFPSESVVVANEKSRAVGKGTVSLQFEKELIMKAFNEPEFNCKILANRIISESSEALYASSYQKGNTCSLL